MFLQIGLVFKSTLFLYYHWDINVVSIENIHFTFFENVYQLYGGDMNQELQIHISMCLID